MSGVYWCVTAMHLLRAEADIPRVRLTHTLTH